MAINENIENQNVLNGAEILPDFTVQTKSGPKMYSGMKVVYQNPENNTFYLENGNEKLILPAATFQSIISPESLHPQPQAFKDAEIAEEIPAAVMGKTVLPEFAMITTQGIQTFKDIIEGNYLYIDKTDSCILHNIQLTRTVKNERIVSLAHEEMLHAPFSLFHLRSLAVGLQIHRIVSTLCLKATIGSIVEDEIIKQLVCSLWHWLVFNQSLQRVGAERIN